MAALNDEDESRAARPNSIFLARVLQGNQMGNQREIDTNASRAAQKAVGASGAASIRPSLVRSAKKGPAAVRQAALSAAQEQKLILCTSLLREVARTFGFRLTVKHGFVTSSDAPEAGPSAPQPAAAPTFRELMEDNSGEEGKDGQQQQGQQQSRGEEDGLQDLGVQLKLPNISIDAWADEEEDDDDEGNEWEDEDGLASKKGTKRGAAAPTPRGSAVLSGIRGRGSMPQQKRIRPKLASNALSSLSMALRKATAPGSMPLSDTKQSSSAPKFMGPYKLPSFPVPEVQPFTVAAQPSTATQQPGTSQPTVMEGMNQSSSTPAQPQLELPDIPKDLLLSADLPPVKPSASPSLQPSYFPFPRSQSPQLSACAEGGEEAARNREGEEEAGTAAGGPCLQQKKTDGRVSGKGGSNNEEGPLVTPSATGTVAGSKPPVAAQALSAGAKQNPLQQLQQPVKRAVKNNPHGLFGAAMRGIAK